MEKLQRLYDKFLSSGNALQVSENGEQIFVSSSQMLAPLLEYIEIFAPHHQKVVIFDKIMGNAAALLCVKANCSEVYSPLGSELAVKTLNKYGIIYHITQIVSYIQKAGLADMCPMERLSIDKNPEEFYQIVKISNQKNK